MSKKIIGIMGAMPEEINGVVSLLKDCTSSTIGMRTYYSGTINGIATVLVFSRWGKVAAASTVATLIHHFHITELVFTGVAGAVNSSLKIGDIVIAKRLVQHDMDARPLMPQYEIPLLSKTYFDCADEQLNLATLAVEDLLAGNNLHQAIPAAVLANFHIAAPAFYVGDIASGDQFFASNFQREQLIKNIPGVLCVEMEGAAVAQVCFEHNVPFTIIRTISDAANDESHIDFASFIESVAGKYSAALINNYINALLHYRIIPIQ